MEMRKGVTGHTNLSLWLEVRVMKWTSINYFYCLDPGCPGQIKEGSSGGRRLVITQLSGQWVLLAPPKSLTVDLRRGEVCAPFCSFTSSQAVLEVSPPVDSRGEGPSSVGVAIWSGLSSHRGSSIILFDRRGVRQADCASLISKRTR